MQGPLKDVKILDFSQLLQGPYATQMLGDFGADVIKVERVKDGDLMRSLTFENYYVGNTDSPCYLAWNRNKRSIALNLKSPESKEIISRLVRECDVVVENFRPGVLEKLGYGYETLKEINPKIIYCSGSGYGQDGPYVERPGQDLLLQGLTGLTMLTGKNDDPPIPLGCGIADQLGAHHMVYGILSALYYREKTGKGQKVDVNLYNSLIAHQLQEYTLMLNAGKEIERPNSGIAHPGNPAPFGIYKTKNGWISIAMNPFDVLVEILDDSSLLKYNESQILYDQRDEVFNRIQDIISEKSTEYWIENMLDRDLWCAEVKSHFQVAEDPQAQHLGIFTSYQHPLAGEVKTVNVPIKLSETPGAITKHPPMVGEHSEEILKELKYTEDEIKLLKEKRIFSVPTT